MTSSLVLVAAVMFIFALIAIVIGIVLYVIFSISLYKIATNAGLENPWLAWVPIGDLYLIGKLIKTLKISTYVIPSIEIVLPVAPFVEGFIGRFPIIGSFIGGLLALANFILNLFVLNKVYRMYKPDSAVLFTVLSIFGLPIPFIFLAIKDLIPVEVVD